MNRRTGLTVAIALVIALCFTSGSALAGTVKIINNCNQSVFVRLTNNGDVGIWKDVGMMTLAPHEVYTYSDQCVMMVHLSGWKNVKYRCEANCLWAKGRWVVESFGKVVDTCLDGCYWRGCSSATFEIYTDTNCDCARNNELDYCSSANPNRSQIWGCSHNDYSTCKVRQLQ